MPKRSNLVSETLMYSINPGTGTLVTHHLPFSRTSPQLELYTAKGFTFEKPVVVATQVEIMPVPIVGKNPLMCNVEGCEFVAKTLYGLGVHQRRHKK